MRSQHSESPYSKDAICFVVGLVSDVVAGGVGLRRMPAGPHQPRPDNLTRHTRADLLVQDAEQGLLRHVCIAKHILLVVFQNVDRDQGTNSVVRRPRKAMQFIVAQVFGYIATSWAM